MTIPEINALIVANETKHSGSDTITGAEVREVDTKLAEELLVRGVKPVPNTAAMSATSGTDYRNILVKNVGFFEWLASGTVDDIDVFTATGGGVWSKVFSGGVSMTALEAPVLTLTPIGANAMQADWTLSADADNYQLFGGEMADFSDEVLLYDGPLLTKNITGLDPLTTIYARVLARGYEKGNSPYGTDSATTDAFVPDIISANRIAEFSIDEGAGQKIFNKVAGNTSDNNLIHAPEKAWGAISNLIPNIYSFSECTKTENYVANSDGNVQMLRLETLSGSIQNPGTGAFAGMRISALTDVLTNTGLHTLSLEVKSNTGVAQNMRMGYGITGYELSSDIVVPTTPTRVSFTFTHVGGGPALYIAINDSAGNPLDISIDKLKIEEGATATAYVTPDFDLGFGLYGKSNSDDPTWVTGKGVAVASQAQYAFGISKNTPTVTNSSGYVVAKVSSSSVTKNVLFSTQFGSGGFEMYFGEGGTTTVAATIMPKVKYRNSEAIAKLTKIADDQYHIITYTYDGTTLRFYIDAVEQASLVVSLTSVQLNYLLLNYSPLVGGYGGAAEINYAILYSAVHSAADVLQNYNALKDIMISRGITLAANDIAVAVEGDSITIDINTYARKAFRKMVPMIGENFATVGATVSVLESRKATVKAWLNASTATTKILSVFIGANDLVSTAGATVLANLKAYCLDMKADVPGLLIAVCSALPRNNAGQLANRAVYNPALVSDSSFYDVLIPFHLNATMGPDAAASDVSRYGDGTHPTNLGHEELEPDYQAGIESLL